MHGKRVLWLVVGGVALAAGLGAAYLVAGGGNKLRPKASPVRVAFAAPAVTGDRPAVAHYQAQLRDLTHATEDLITPLEFTTVTGPVDSHVVWLNLDFDYDYLLRVRGVAANGAVGLWSEWSEIYENSPPWQNPEPPTD